VKGNVETRPTFYPATTLPQARGYGIGTFNASLAPLLQPTTDLLFSTRFKSFLSDSNLAIDITENGNRKDCGCRIQNKMCRMEYYVPGGIENAAPAILANHSFINTGAIQPVLTMNQQGYDFEFEDSNLPWQYNPVTDCTTHGFALGAFQLCLKNRASNKIQARKC
jgi:hypothetical protein